MKEKKRKRMLETFGHQSLSLNKRDRLKITVVQPYEFEEREKLKKELNVKSIRQVKLDEDLEEKKIEEDKIVAMATSFRAKRPPKHIA